MNEPMTELPDATNTVVATTTLGDAPCATSSMLDLTPPPFDGVIGQTAAKARLQFYLDGYKGNGIIPNMLFVAAKGQGKTLLARETARNLRYIDPETKTSKSKKFIEINCSTVKSVNQLFNDTIINYVRDQYCTVLFDEASELPRDVSMAFLTVLNPNPSNRTSFSTDNMVIDFDFRMQTFLFATSEPQKVFHALADRLDRIELEDYSLEDLALIVNKNFKGTVEVPEDVMVQISSVLRGNARAAQNIATKMKTMLGTKSEDKRDKFSMEDWLSLKRKLSILPMGLMPMELRILNLLNERKCMTLTTIAAAMSMTPSSVRRDIETHLLKTGLMAIGQLSKRELTAKGSEYLRAYHGPPTVCKPA